MGFVGMSIKLNLRIFGFVNNKKMNKLLLRPKNLYTFAQTSAKILISNSTNIYFNLAYQEFLFEHTNLNCPTLLLYRNSPTIVIGKHQNPWKQCRNELMRESEVILSRRKTGGGAVYQDMGNSCFSFLTPYEYNQSYDYKTVNNKILISAFANLGVSVEEQGRNDLQCQGRKMSGSAYRLYLGGHQGRGKKALHHGTILFNVDLNALQKYLNPNKKKLLSKGVDSVIKRVMNLNEVFPHVSHEPYMRQLQKEFSKHYQCVAQKQILDEKQLITENPTIRSNYERLSSWNWLYGQCPQFKYTIDKKFEWAMTQVTYDVADGVIKQGKVYSDCLYPDFIAAVNEEIAKGVKYDRQGLIDMEKRLISRLDSNMHSMALELCEWMKAEL